MPQPNVRSETVLNLLTLTGTVLAILAAITARNASAAANAGALAGHSDECIPSVAAWVWGYGNHPTWWLKPRRSTSRSIGTTLFDKKLGHGVDKVVG